MRTASILFIALLTILMVYVGCERKVTETIIVEESTDCFLCHGDAGYLLQAKGEWANSTHASGNNVDYTNRDGSGCTKCHNHQGFLEFVATGDVTEPYDSVSAIHCFTCHAPHTRGDLSLRTVAAVTLVDGDTYDQGVDNLCANCHQARTSPSGIGDNFVVTSSHYGPHHGPQADIMLATLGYEYDAYSYESSGHTGIEKGCIGCHMGQGTFHDGYEVGGHSFNIIDEDGYNISGFCESCHPAADGIDFDADADYDWDGETEGYQTEIAGLLDSLGILLTDLGHLDDGHPIRNDTIADADEAGALWNYLLIEEDQSHGIHNFKYLHGLLESSIKYLNDEL